MSDPWDVNKLVCVGLVLVRSWIQSSWEGLTVGVSCGDKNCFIGHPDSHNPGDSIL